MNKALFYRKCSTAEEYFKLFHSCPDLGFEMNFIIAKTIILSDEEYTIFINNFLCDNLNIEKITNELFIDETDCVHCGFFTVDGLSGFLVYPSGYKYARYVAFYHSKEPYRKEV